MIDLWVFLITHQWLIIVGMITGGALLSVSIIAAIDSLIVGLERRRYRRARM